MWCAPAMHLTAVVPATCTSGEVGHTDREVLASLCGHSPHHRGILDRLVHARSLTARRSCRDTEEVA